MDLYYSSFFVVLGGKSRGADQCRFWASKASGPSLLSPNEGCHRCLHATTIAKQEHPASPAG